MALTFAPLAELGSACPDFRLPGVDGKSYARQDFMKQKPFLVMFICNHCPYVKAIEDRLISLARDLSAVSVPTIAICSNDADEYGEDSFTAAPSGSFSERSMPRIQ